MLELRDLGQDLPPVRRALENRYDVEQSERALAEQGDEPLIPYEQVRRELRL